MKKSTILKTIILILIFTIISCLSTTVFADDETLDLTDSLTGGSSSSQEDQNTTPEPEQPSVDATPDATPNEETNTEADANNNSSSYQESEIPYAGPAESIAMIVAFVACAITGIYTFIKLSDYNNI